MDTIAPTWYHSSSYTQYCVCVCVYVGTLSVGLSLLDMCKKRRDETIIAAAAA